MKTLLVIHFAVFLAARLPGRDGRNFRSIVGAKDVVVDDELLVDALPWKGYRPVELVAPTRSWFWRDLVRTARTT